MKVQPDFKEEQGFDGKKPNGNALPTNEHIPRPKPFNRLRSKTHWQVFLNLSFRSHIYLKLLVQIASMFSVNYFCRRSLPPKAFLDRQNGLKNNKVDLDVSINNITVSTNRKSSYINISQPVLLPRCAIHAQHTFHARCEFRQTYIPSLSRTKYSGGDWGERPCSPQFLLIFSNALLFIRGAHVRTSCTG